jgi:L-seryl-tRNA(Ser) seleniumtransferase
VQDDVLAELGLAPLINASGTETVYGASPVHDEVIRAMAAILPRSVSIAELQAAASQRIAKLTGAEAGYVTGCTSASIAIAVAACMTGLDLGAVERLPDTRGLRNGVVIQKGHVVNYGSSITGDIRITGAAPVEIGVAAECGLYQLRAALDEGPAAAVFVVSHHVVPTGQIALAPFIAACHAAGVPVIVDAAAEYGWRGMLAAGADLVLFSAQKAIGGPTAGIIAGRRSLVHACHAQGRGIGRPMKAGKEAIVGALAALDRWSSLDENDRRAQVEGRAAALAARLQGLNGIEASVVPDETGNPFSRVVLTIDPARSGVTAFGLAKALADGRPGIIVRSLYADRGILQIDVRRMDDATVEMVAQRIREAIPIAAARGTEAPPAPADASADAVLRWLDGGEPAAAGTEPDGPCAATLR